MTCPTMRYHPAIVAQASATVAALFEDRFFLGVGSGENLNEHIMGERWPRAAERLQMLDEAIAIIRDLWQGEVVSHAGQYFSVDEARLYTLPQQTPDLYVAASGPMSASLAAQAGDGLIGVAPDKDLINHFREEAPDKPAYGQVHVCYAESEEKGRNIVQEWWPNSGLGGDLNWETKTPELFEVACETLSVDQITEHIACGPDVEAHVKAIKAYADAGYSHAYVHQIGPHQAAFLKSWDEELGDALAAGQC